MNMKSEKWQWPTAQLALSEQLRQFLENAGPAATLIDGTREQPKAVEMLMCIREKYQVQLGLFVNAENMIFGTVDIWQIGPGRKMENVYMSAVMPSVVETLANLKGQYEAWSVTAIDPRKPDLRLVKSE
jgi:hypothetical protein